MSKLLVLPVVAGALLLVGPSAATAAGVPDATCPGPSDDQIARSGNERLAQTFTALTTGNLTDAQVEVTKSVSGSGGDWIISINSVHASGAPTNTVLATTTLPDATVPSGDATVIGTFASPAPVTAGEQYAVVVTRPGSDSVAVRIRNTDACGGEAFLSVSQDAQFQSMTFLGFPGLDIVFTVFVEPTPPDTDPPETTITKDAPKTTEKHKVKFKFSSDEAGSSFECKLDKQPYKPCTSPKKVKVDDGKHKFAVRATDAAGNVDPTPDKDKFKVVG